jgi:hypothetical protein
MRGLPVGKDIQKDFCHTVHKANGFVISNPKALLSFREEHNVCCV